MTKKGWFTNEACKMEGEVEKLTPDKKSTVVWKIKGNWNSKIMMAPVVDDEVDEAKWETVYEKPPYPDNW